MKAAAFNSRSHGLHVTMDTKLADKVLVRCPVPGCGSGPRTRFHEHLLRDHTHADLAALIAAAVLGEKGTA